MKSNHEALASPLLKSLASMSNVSSIFSQISCLPTCFFGAGFSGFSASSPSAFSSGFTSSGAVGFSASSTAAASSAAGVASSSAASVASASVAASASVVTSTVSAGLLSSESVIAANDVTPVAVERMDTAAIAAMIDFLFLMVKHSFLINISVSDISSFRASVSSLRSAFPKSGVTQKNF